MTKQTLSIAELRKLDEKQLVEKLLKAKLRVQELVSNLSVGKLKNVREIASTRRFVAKLATVLQEKSMLKEASNAEA